MMKIFILHWRVAFLPSTHQAALPTARLRPMFTAMSNSRVTVWYDGACPLCVAEISLIKRLDQKRGRIALVDLSGDGSCPLDRDAMLARFHAQESGGPIVSGAAAFATMWRHVTPFQPLGYLALFPPVLWALEGAYRFFLRVRPRLQAFVRARTQPR
jgi:predicted DCC family thiol-disulfide oxidoreductase YuxK